MIETSNIKTYTSAIETTNIITDSLSNEITNANIDNFSIETSSIINEESSDESNYIKNKKCKKESIQSSFYDLCIECNNELGFYQVILPNRLSNNNFIECYSENTRPINFYFNSTEKKYKICYETCLTCDKEGNEYIHNCIKCDKKHIKRPESPDTTNCVTQCKYSYYFTHYGQYKCTNNSYCPQEANLYISELKKCTDNCNKEKNYKFQYGGRCLINCPDNTSPNSENICKDTNTNLCSKTENEIDLHEFLNTGGVDFNAKNYAKEFNYTKKHVSHFYNNLYSILLYKDSYCIEELSINMPKIDFGSGYTKVLKNLNPQTNDKIIIALIEKINEKKESTISYSFYHPITGEKINAGNICKEEKVIVTEKRKNIHRPNEYELLLNLLKRANRQSLQYKKKNVM